MLYYSRRQYFQGYFSIGLFILDKCVHKQICSPLLTYGPLQISCVGCTPTQSRPGKRRTLIEKDPLYFLQMLVIFVLSRATCEVELK